MRRSPGEVRSPFRTCMLAILVGLAATASIAPATATEDGYRLPPPPLPAIVDTIPTPSISVSPDRDWILVMVQPNLPPIEELAEPELRIAGRRIRPRTNGPSRSRHVTRLAFKRLSDLVERWVTGLPEGARIGRPSWSPDSKHIAFTVTGDNEIRLWVADVSDGKARRLGDFRLNAAGGNPIRWLEGSESLVCTIVPEDRGDEPSAPLVPGTPVIQENIGKTAPARTYQDLLKNPHDEKLFEYYLASQLVRVHLDGEIKNVGSPGIVWDFNSSPNHNFLLVEILHRPFSYLVPASRFPRRIEVWNLDGEVVHQVADLPLQDEVPVGFGSVPTGPRSVSWRSDDPATLYWTEAQDGGDARAEADLRDSVFVHEAPFKDPPRKLIDLALRYGGVQWGNDDLALVSEWWWKTRKVRGWKVRPGRRDAEPVLMMDRSFEDRYGDPGDPVTIHNQAGRPVLLITGDEDKLYLIGDGASPEGDRPFFDIYDVNTKESKRLWRSEAPYYERPIAVLDDSGNRLLTRRESRDEPPNYFVRDLESDELTQLSYFPHPTPQLKGLQKELIRYERADGVKLTGTLYLPPGYSKDDGPLPLLVWAYPQEFKSADAAGQVTDSPHRFDRIGWYSALLFLTLGYAVLDDPSLPIVGEGDVEPNDTFVDQLVAGARAAIDEVVRRGVADPDRVAVGGHSYGAFMTANLLAHSDLFRAGIARSGAYNRTLTPFGFQAEERTFWEAPEVYFEMSPFMHASKIDEPILLIHGAADNNSGTFPMQSERFYNALKGHGATTRLVMLPHESHGYRARESIMHMLWEMATWLDTYVKSAPPREPSGSTGAASAD